MHTAGSGRIHASGCPSYLLSDDEDVDNYTANIEGTEKRKHERDSAAICCTCGSVDVAEERRALKVLSCARININLRQVYPLGNSDGDADQRDGEEGAG